MNEQTIIKCMKHMLKDRRRHAVMRIVIYMIESIHKNNINEPLTLSSETPFLKNHFDSVGAKEFIKDLNELATIATEHMATNLVEEREGGDLYVFKFDDVSAYFVLPKKQGRLHCVKKEDKINHRLKLVWSNWVTKIGSIKEMYPRGVPSLTPARKKAILDALSIKSPEFLDSVIEGTLRSPYHMGYIIDKSGKVTRGTKYCCPTNIFRNEHKMEALAAKINEQHYQKQIDEAEKRRSLRVFSVEQQGTKIEKKTISSIDLKGKKSLSMLDKVLNGS